MLLTKGLLASLMTHISAHLITGLDSSLTTPQLIVRQTTRNPECGLYVNGDASKYEQYAKEKCLVSHFIDSPLACPGSTSWCTLATLNLYANTYIGCADLLTSTFWQACFESTKALQYQGNSLSVLSW